MKTLSQKVDEFTPIVCRLLARKGRGKSVEPMTDEEIAKSCGLTVGDVIAISWNASWNGVPVDVMIKYTKGCGVDFDDRSLMDKHSKYLSRMTSKPRAAWSYLKKHPDWRHRWYRMIEIQKEYYEKNHESS